MVVRERYRRGNLRDGAHMTNRRNVRSTKRARKRRIAWIVWVSTAALSLAACTAPVAETGQAAYAARCATCHGDKGNGDGPVARQLPDAPTRFADPAWRKSVDRAYVEAVITYGGSHVGISPLMPSNSDLAGNEPLMNELVGFVLQLGK